jgi:cyclase
MLARRIIPCLDVRSGFVVKGIRFQNHRILGSPLELASFYSEQGADELVFYDITASCTGKTVCLQWIHDVAALIHIPFTVAGGITTVQAGESILNAGADKLSINSPAIARPELVNELSAAFGSQCVVIGVDSQWINDDYYVYQYTGDVTRSQNTHLKTVDWIQEVQARGAGEIVLNCMQSDGVRQGFDIAQLQQIRAVTEVPLVASGGAGCADDFVRVFQEAQVDGALAASIFHDKQLSIFDLKQVLSNHNIEIRL